MFHQPVRVINKIKHPGRLDKIDIPHIVLERFRLELRDYDFPFYQLVKDQNQIIFLGFVILELRKIVLENKIVFQKNSDQLVFLFAYIEKCFEVVKGVEDEISHQLRVLRDPHTKHLNIDLVFVLAVAF